MAGNLFWETFQVLSEEPEKPLTKLVATDILDTFDIPHTNEAGGYLKHVDIKRADALSVLKAALLEVYAQSGEGLKEMYIDADGKATFYEVGALSSNLHPYYTIPASNFVRPKVSVMITGGKPKQERLISTDWYPLIGFDNDNYSLFDTTKISSTCFAGDFSTHAVITYKDPFRHNPNTSWNDGVADVFELKSPFERFIGLTWRITPPEDKVTTYTKIYKQSQSSIPILLNGEDAEDYRIGDTEGFPNLGIPKKRTNRSFSTADINDCKQYEDGTNYCSTTTIPVPVSKNMIEGVTYEVLRGGALLSKFLGVQAVFIVGILLQACFGIAKPGKQTSENNEENTALFIGTINAHNTVCRLTEGIHYTVLYSQDLITDPTGIKDPCIQLANNLRYYDNAKIGTGVPFNINVQSTMLSSYFNNTFTGVGSVLPLENGGGVLVQQIWGQISLDAPSFLVVDPSGQAYNIAQELKVEVLPLVLKDVPSPIAMNGTLINQEDSVLDNDPTTVQDLQETSIERAYNEMSSGRTLSLSFASLDEDQIVTLSKKLHDILLEDTGDTYTHTCPPTDQPILGSRGSKGGIVNSIEYSYTDQGSYLINVVEGPKYFGDFSGIDGGIYYKRTDEVTVQGTITQDLGNHVQYVVHVDGIGPIQCINACGAVLAVRDRVSITIHNNAVES